MNIAMLFAALKSQVLLRLIQAQDFKIPQPSDTGHAAPSPAPAPAPLPFRHVATGPSTIEIVLAVLAALVAAGIFFLLRGALFNYLIEKRVPPSAANGAGWAFFAFLLAATWTAIAGFVVDLWMSVPFLIAGCVVTFATFVFFLVSFLGALGKAN